jgi:hypothetical protein
MNRREIIERRTVIEAYAKYDCLKKGRQQPDFAACDWSQADVIDRKMELAGLKTGILAGYRLWDKVEVTMSDLRECAVFADIFPGQPRQLGLVRLHDWDHKLLQYLKGSPRPSWYGRIKKGEVLDETAPLMLRPAVRGEFPARWYIEDGSGRAITFLANHALFADTSQTLALGYLGPEPDPCSSFMQRKFPDLLNPNRRG